MTNGTTNSSKTLEFLKRPIENMCTKHAFDREDVRRAYMLIGFCYAGFTFCTAYVIFYLLIGYEIGALYIGIADLACIALPLLLKRTGNLSLTGGVATTLIILLFLTLSTLEGGLHGHAIGWLAAMPLCAFLLSGKTKQGFFFAFAMALGVVLIATRPWTTSYTFPLHYPAEMNDMITAIGFIGLALFMVAIGALFEGMRASAIEKANSAMNQLEVANESLAQLVAEKDKFMEIAAHDLKNPLQGIRGFTELLLSNPNTDQITLKNCPHIIESSDRMLGIINNLLDVNAMEAGRYPIRPEISNLEPLLLSCLQAYERAAANKGVTWEIETASTKAWVDTGAWKQVADNLVSNAVKFVIPGGNIRITLDYQDQFALLTIGNQCQNFSEEDFESLFQRFARLSTRPTGGESSTGLGLSITHKLVNDMGGTISCKNEDSFGPVFTASFLRDAPSQDKQSLC